MMIGSSTLIKDEYDRVRVWVNCREMVGIFVKMMWGFYDLDFELLY